MDTDSPISRAFRQLLPRVVDTPSDFGTHTKVLVKSVVYSQQQHALYCYCYVFQSQTNVTVNVTGLLSFAGYNAENGRCSRLEAHLAQSPSVADTTELTVFLDQLRRRVPAVVAAFTDPQAAECFLDRCGDLGLHFGEFKRRSGSYHYVQWDGNTPALVNNLMFGKIYYLPRDKLCRADGWWVPSDFLYCKDEQAKFTVDIPKVCKDIWVTCALDIETVYDNKFRDQGLICADFVRDGFPYVTEFKLAKQARELEVINRVMKRLGGNRAVQPKKYDMSGLLHEITSVSVVVTNHHLPKTPDRHKSLLVIYNRAKTNADYVVDEDVCRDAGVSPDRVRILPTKDELGLLATLIGVLIKHKVEIVYLYHANFDLRVLEQRVRFYAFKGRPNCCAVHCGSSDRRFKLLDYWNQFMTKCQPSTARNLEYVVQFDTIKLLNMYDDLIVNMKRILKRHFTHGDITAMEAKNIFPKDRVILCSKDDDDSEEDTECGAQPRATASTTSGELIECTKLITQFNKQKKKIGHFKMKGLGTAIIDLYCLCYTQEKKYKYTNLKLDTVAAGEVSAYRRMRGLPTKAHNKLHKVQDVTYERLDAMIHSGGKDLFCVLLYNLVDSLLCIRLSKTMVCLQDLLYKCLASYNIDFLSHGRLENFQGFVQSIHSVSMPMLKVKQDKLIATAECLCRPVNLESKWEGGAVADPLKGLHYATRELGLEICLDYKSMYPSLMIDLNISPEMIEQTDVVHPSSEGWLAYDWQWTSSDMFANMPRNENIPCLSLIAKLDASEFKRHKATLPSSVDMFLQHRQTYKQLKSVAKDTVLKQYYTKQEFEMKVLANSHYGTAEWPCGPMIAAHGRRLIGFVNKIMNTKSDGRCVQIYGDTDSTMFVCQTVGDFSGSTFADMVDFIGRKFVKANNEIKAFLSDIKNEMIQDCLRRMVYISEGQRLAARATGAIDSSGVQIYVVDTEVGPVVINEAFVSEYKTELEYETAASVFCHVSKKTYVALVHELNADGEVVNTKAKTKGLSAYKSNKNAGTLLVTDFFVDIIVRGHAVLSDPSTVDLLTAKPWCELSAGCTVLHPTEVGVTQQIVATVTTADVNGYVGVSVTFKEGGEFRTLYKHKVSFSHICSREECARRNAVYSYVATVLTLKYSAGIFDWSHLPKVESAERFHEETLRKFVARGVYDSVTQKVPYVTLTQTHLAQIFRNGNLTINIKAPAFHRQDPAVALLGRLPLETHAKTMVSMLVGGGMICASRDVSCDAEAKECRDNWPIATRPTMTQVSNFHIKYPLSVYEMSDRFDRLYVNSKGKFLTHVAVNSNMPYGEFIPEGTDMLALSSSTVTELKRVASVINGACESGKKCLMNIMRTCPPELIVPPQKQSYSTATDLGAFKLQPSDAAEMRKVLEDIGYDPSAMSFVSEIVNALTVLTHEKLIALKPLSEHRVMGSIPIPVANLAGVPPNTRGIQLRSTASSDSRLLRLAQLLYFQTVLCHITTPESFPPRPSALSMLPNKALMCTKALCVSPKSCTSAVLKEWIKSFKLYTSTHKHYKYHCIKCKDFFIALQRRAVEPHQMVKCLYNNRDGVLTRKLGKCTLE